MNRILANVFADPSARQWAIHAAGLALMFSASLAYYHGVYRPLELDADDRMRRAAQLQLLVAHAEQVASDHNQLGSRLETLRTAARSIRRRMPPLEPGIDLINQVSQVAKSAGLQVVHCTAGLPQTKESHSTVEVVCRMTGSYLSVCRYLAALDQLPQVATVSRLDVQTAANSWTYPVEVTFRLYYGDELHDTKLRHDAP